MAHKYKQHKITKHRSLEIPEGFELLEVKKDEHQPNLVKVIFRKK